MSKNDLSFESRIDNSVVQDRMNKIQKYRSEGTNPYPSNIAENNCNTFTFLGYDPEDVNCMQSVDNDVLQERFSQSYIISGRVRFQRILGKIGFIKIEDSSTSKCKKVEWGKFKPTDNFLQIFATINNMGEENYNHFKTIDLGDFIQVEGFVSRTSTDEISLFARKVTIISKNIRPLPDKFHGMAEDDLETRYRKRYLDLIMRDGAKETFINRSKIISQIRNYMIQENYLEVETPILHNVLGGANARPFSTHHNSLDQDFYMRIAPELYLKRLIVGGMERVFEIGKNFRNEGLSQKHNPEFTMIEFYAAYSNYHQLMSMIRNMICSISGKSELNWNGHNVNMANWTEISMINSVATYFGITSDRLYSDMNFLILENEKIGTGNASSLSWGKLIANLFENYIEPSLIDPTFVIDFPVDVSPLAKRSDTNHLIADRFELYIGGVEIANGFNELNDPKDQFERFAQQLQNKDAGDLEAMQMDLDYIEALEYGMPPTAGAGIGIDRLVMLLLEINSIKDVILFPALRSISQ